MSIKAAATRGKIKQSPSLLQTMSGIQTPELIESDAYLLHCLTRQEDNMGVWSKAELGAKYMAVSGSAATNRVPQPDSGRPLLIEQNGSNDQGSCDKESLRHLEEHFMVLSENVTAIRRQLDELERSIKRFLPEEGEG